jgi:hypothetical protein
MNTRKVFEMTQEVRDDARRLIDDGYTSVGTYLLEYCAQVDKLCKSSDAKNIEIVKNKYKW